MAKRKQRVIKGAKSVKIQKNKEEEPHSVLMYQYRCTRCAQSFPNINKLKLHSQKHTDTLKEMKMLVEGQMPEANKMGSEFKGKNRVIIS